MRRPRTIDETDFIESQDLGLYGDLFGRDEAILNHELQRLWLKGAHARNEDGGPVQRKNKAEGRKLAAYDFRCIVLKSVADRIEAADGHRPNSYRVSSIIRNLAYAYENDLTPVVVHGVPSS